MFSITSITRDFNGFNIRSALIIKIGLSLALSLSCINASAVEYFRWKDADGTVHFTDKPPVGKEFKKFKASNKATDEEEEKKELSPLAQATAKRCASEKERMNVLQNNKSISMTNGDGTSFVLTAEQIKTEIERTKKNIATYCD